MLTPDVTRMELNAAIKVISGAKRVINTRLSYIKEVIRIIVEEGRFLIPVSFT